MSTYFVTRHAGARVWAREQGIEIDAVIEHLDPAMIEPEDRVLGTLPVNLAAQVCERGGRYLHLSLDTPPHLRGRELTAAELRACGARLEEYRVMCVILKRRSSRPTESGFEPMP